MKLSLSEAATVLGKSLRQVRYLIKTGRLAAAKDGGSWSIESSSLPLTEEQRQALVTRMTAAREALSQALAPADKVAGGEGEKRHYTVKDLAAFQAGRALYREAEQILPPDHPACRLLRAALALVARGCHNFHPGEKVRRFVQARDLAATALTELLLPGGQDGERLGALADRLEQELIPKISGLVAALERKSSRGRFERFGSTVLRGASAG